MVPVVIHLSHTQAIGVTIIIQGRVIQL